MGFGRTIGPEFRLCQESDLSLMQSRQLVRFTGGTKHLITPMSRTLGITVGQWEMVVGTYKGIRGRKLPKALLLGR